MESAIEALEQASSQGHWILLHNTQQNPTLLSRLSSQLCQLPAREKWKVWISVQGDCADIPSSLLRSASKVVLDPPRSLCGGVLYCLNSLAGDIVSSSVRVEWLPILHCMAMLHTTVCLRKHVYVHAWSTDFTWTHQHFMVSVHACVNYNCCICTHVSVS